MATSWQRLSLSAGQVCGQGWGWDCDWTEELNSKLAVLERVTQPTVVLVDFAELNQVEGIIWGHDPYTLSKVLFQRLVRGRGQLQSSSPTPGIM